MTHDEMIAVIQAHKEGKEIEDRIKGYSEWVATKSPCWNFDCIDYRIKPEPHYRPFKNAEEVIEAIRKHGSYFRIDNGDVLFNIIAISDEAINLSEGRIALNSTIRENLTFADGTPFGVKEDFD